MVGAGSRRASLHPSSPHRVNQLSYLQQQQMQGPMEGGDAKTPVAGGSNQEYADMMQRVNGSPFSMVSSFFSFLILPLDDRGS